MGALDGILVVAVEQAVAAPLCTARLAQAGARVIKIERPGGDFARGYDTAAKGESSYFTWLNQGKESLVLDFKQPEDAALLRRILAKADVLVQNLAPGALARAGFDNGTLRAANAALITCSISGYGETGEVAKRPAYDLLVQAETGLIATSGAPGHPGRIGVSICDIGTGVTAYGAVLEALIKRGRTGEGEELSLSLFDVSADWMAVPFIHAEYGSGPPQPVGLCHPSIAPYGAFETGDGKLTLLSIQNEREWGRLCADVLEVPTMATDIRFVSNNARVANRDELEAQMGSITHVLTAQEFRDRLARARIAFGAINGADDLARHAAFRGMNYGTVQGQTITLPAPPGQELQNTRTPQIDEHGAAIRAQFAVEGDTP
ncbi:MAG: CaiB/BaiF CoA-transferase family protein [Pseudomonadota bacterium]